MVDKFDKVAGIEFLDRHFPNNAGLTTLPFGNVGFMHNGLCDRMRYEGVNYYREEGKEGRFEVVRRRIAGTRSPAEFQRLHRGVDATLVEMTGFVIACNLEIPDSPITQSAGDYVRRIAHSQQRIIEEVVDTIGAATLVTG